ncbi:MAG: thioredoxin domain-containing protein [Synechococcales cyanobacterium T60_A2020_003]|nr:thioredoxin domain-containing protein [Synechococcales cyanobacterium T60_A2020_003]
MPNRLAAAQSLYLRKHADNPIDWYPWGEEALTKAKQENKPIFLSIGYSSCHWCTVMEGEAFSDGAIAEYMNAHFVPIKVDREERPDLDSIYMQALQLMTGQGGWPLNVFLSPDDRVPFYGGTYFPVEPRYGRPGFLQILQAIHQFYHSETTKLKSVKSEIYERLHSAATVESPGNLEAGLLRTGLEYCAGILSHRGNGQSFPMIPYAETALRGVRFQFPDAKYEADKVCVQRGLNLALGGIYDHVAGGFHRYTVDPTWTVPHFEKMLYDNGQIVEYLANLCAAGAQDPAFERAIAGTVQWLTREMRPPDGYFYAAQDADSFITPDDAEPEEGAFYVWRYSDLKDILSDEELAELTAQFMITESGNFEGQIVLQRNQPGELSAIAESGLRKLFTVRYGTPPEETPSFPPARNNAEAKGQNWPGRIPAVTDTKMIVAWNSLMISGLARAAAVLNRPDYLALAAQTAQFILTHQRVGDRLHRLNYDGSVSVLAQSEDYALFIKALLDLDQASLTLGIPSDWIPPAIALQNEFDQFLWSSDLGGYFNTDAQADLVVRERSAEDNATPSANGVAIANLIRLALIAEDLSYLERAEQALNAFGVFMTNAPQACPSLFVALDWFRNYTLVRTTPDRIRVLGSQYVPTVVLKHEPDLPAGAIALVCQGLSCNEPAQSTDQLRDQLMQSTLRA